MGLLDFLGGSSSGNLSNKSTSSLQQVPTLTTQQNDLLTQLNTLMAGQLGQGVSPYTGQMVAPFSNLQNQGFNYYGGMMPAAQQAQSIYGQSLANYNPQQGQNYLNQAQPALNSMLQNYDPASATNYWNEAFTKPAMQNWQKNVAPSILERYGSGGNTGAMNQQLAQTADDMQTGLNAQLANLQYQGQQAQLGRQQTGINQAMNMAQMPGQLALQGSQIGAQGSDMASQMMNAGALQQQNSQQQLSAAYNQWQQAQGYNNPYLKYLGTALGTPAFENVTTLASQPSSSSSMMLPLLGAFMNSGMGQGMLGSLFGGGSGGSGVSYTPGASSLGANYATSGADMGVAGLFGDTGFGSGMFGGLGMF
jgi:hypothetical protein